MDCLVKDSTGAGDTVAAVLKQVKKRARPLGFTLVGEALSEAAFHSVKV